jgi:O-antigen ligase
MNNHDCHRYIQRLHQIEITGLYFLILFLPFLKVPKNIGLGIFIIGGIGWRLSDKSIGFRKPDIYELILGLFFISAAISTALNWPLAKGINGLRDSFTVAVIGLLIYNSTLTKNQIKWIANLSIIGIIIGLCYGFVTFYKGGTSFFELKNMTVAEASIITGMTIAIVTGILSETGSEFSVPQKFALGISGLIMLCCILLMGNRSGMVGIACFFGMFFILNIKNIKIYIILLLTIIALMASIMVLSPDGRLKQSMRHLLSTKISLSSSEKFTSNDQLRFTYWKLSLLQFKFGKKKIFGIGPRNYYKIDFENLIKKSKGFKIKTFKGPHAHNMYLTKLCEEGLFGLCVMMMLFVFVINRLYKYIKNKGKINWIFIACAGSIIIPAIAGIFYAPYRREVAWVSILFISLFMNMYKNTPDT